MSRKTALCIEFLSCVVLSVLFGAWLLLSYQHWRNSDLTVAWVLGAVVLAGAVAFDTYTLLKKIS